MTFSQMQNEIREHYLEAEQAANTILATSGCSQKQIAEQKGMAAVILIAAQKIADAVDRQTEDFQEKCRNLQRMGLTHEKYPPDHTR